jgi:MFS transporter, DHA2 family, multidrug resistance protein
MTEAEKQPVQWLIVFAVVLTAVLEVLDTTIVNVALPHIKAAFGITSDQTVWIVTSYIVASIAVMPLTGLLSRKFGRRRLIITAIVGFAFFSALGGMAQNFEMLVFFRLGQGFFGAFLIPLSQAILFTSFPREKRGQAMAIFGLGVIVAPVLGPTIGAILTEHFSWRAVFYVNMPIAFIALLMVSGELKKEETQHVDIDWVGLLLMVTAIGALQMTLDLGESHDWFDSHLIQITAITSAVTGIIFFTRGIGRKLNIIDFSLLKDRSFAAGNVAIVGFGVSMFGAIAILPLFVQGLLDYPVLESGELFIPRGIAAGFSMVVTGSFLVNRFDPRMLLAVGLILTGAGNIMLTNLNLEVSFWQLSWPGVVSGLGMGLFFVPMSTLAFQNISREKQDEASGIYSVMRSLGSSVGIAIIGWQLARRTNLHYAILTEQITPFNPAVSAYLAPLGLSPTTGQGAKVLANEVLAQASMLAFQDAFLLSGLAAFAMLPMVLLIQKPQKSDIKAPASVH